MDPHNHNHDNQDKHDDLGQMNEQMGPTHTVENTPHSFITLEVLNRLIDRRVDLKLEEVVKRADAEQRAEDEMAKRANDAQERADAEHARANRENVRADREKARADLAQIRYFEEKTRADNLAGRVTELTEQIVRLSENLKYRDQQITNLSLLSYKMVNVIHPGTFNLSAYKDAEVSHKEQSDEEDSRESTHGNTDDEDQAQASDVDTEAAGEDQEQSDDSKYWPPSPKRTRR